MIPHFPYFKHLRLSDKNDVDFFTRKYLPYSDFNFAGTWSWDIRNQMKISQLNGNYIIRFIDYLTGEPFYTFLGSNDINDTTKKLLDLSKKEKIEAILRLIPEESISGINKLLFEAKEDRDNFDYVYEIEKLKDYKGPLFASKRGLARRFFKRNPTALVRELSLKNSNDQLHIIKLYKKWLSAKLGKRVDVKTDDEIVIIKKFFVNADEFRMESVGVFVGESLIAFSLSELKDSEYAISHLVKTDPSQPYVFAFLMQKNAEILFSYGKRYLNFEQDLGVPQLRYAKEKFRPSFFLKKYKLSYKQVRSCFYF